jgi:hypothetical protein
MTRALGPTASPDISASRRPPAVAAVDWGEAIDIATALLRKRYALSDTMDGPMAAAQAVPLAAFLCAYDLLPEQRDNRVPEPSFGIAARQLG